MGQEVSDLLLLVIANFWGLEASLSFNPVALDEGFEDDCG
jgi:hypothetical protein